MKDLRHWVAKMLKLENQSLWQKVNSFEINQSIKEDDEYLALS